MKWLLIVLLFQSGEVMDYKIIGARTEAECKEGAGKVREHLKPSGLDVWTACVPMTYEHKPQLKKDRDS